MCPFSRDGPLFDWPLARKTDPGTSWAAARAVEDSCELAGLRRRAVELVTQNPGRIARELSSLAGDSDPRTLNRRLGEVEDMGLVRRGEARRCAVTNKLCATWWPADEEIPF
jgi:hypothetical protein